MKEQNVILDKSMEFAVRIVNLCGYLKKEKKETVLSTQLLRCGTSVGANIREAIYAQSRKDFRAKMQISLKEASETEYWLELLQRTGYLNKQEYESIQSDCSEVVKMLISIVKATENC